MKRGFTLIELLVVISIISLLASVVLSAIQDAKAEAEDATFIQEALELRKAVDMYKTQYGKAPRFGEAGASTSTIAAIDSTVSPPYPVHELSKLVEEKFITKITPSKKIKLTTGLVPDITYSNHSSTSQNIVGDTDPYTYAFRINSTINNDEQIYCLTSSGLYLESVEGDVDNQCNQK